MSRKKYIFLSAVLIVLSVAIIFYIQDSDKKPYKVDVSGVEIEEVEISRYEKLLFEANPFLLREAIEPYSDEFYFFLGDELGNPVAMQQLYDYVTDPLIIELYNKTIDVFPDLNNLEQELTYHFRYYNYHFPERDIPDFYSYVSGLDLKMPIKYIDNNVAIAVDMYLGDNIDYLRYGVPAYQVMRRSEEFIVRDIMYKIAKDMTGSYHNPETLIDFMIYEGIKLYFIDCMMPDVADTIKIAYTSHNKKWMKDNEKHVWSYFIDKELLFSTNKNRINRFITDAPFTSPFARDSAPRAAVWIGWQIVKEYMRRNSDIELYELIKTNDSKRILSESRYKPR